MTLPRIAIRWTQRDDPLVPLGVAAVGDRARAIARRLLREDFAGHMEKLRAVGTTDALLLLGRMPDLPWVDGAVYLGKDPDAGSLLIPANMVPSVPIDAVERCFAACFTELQPPIVVLPAQRRVFSAAPALPLAKSHLVRWLEGDR